MIKIIRKNIGFLKPRRKIVDKSGKYVERFEPSKKLLLAIGTTTLGFSFYALNKYTKFRGKKIKSSEIDIN